MSSSRMRCAMSSSMRSDPLAAFSTSLRMDAIWRSSWASWSSTSRERSLSVGISPTSSSAVASSCAVGLVLTVSVMPMKWRAFTVRSLEASKGGKTALESAPAASCAHTILMRSSSPVACSASSTFMAYSRMDECVSADGSANASLMGWISALAFARRSCTGLGRRRSLRSTTAWDVYALSSRGSERTRFTRSPSSAAVVHRWCGAATRPSERTRREPTLSCMLRISCTSAGASLVATSAILASQ
mmetsp:Transcript_21574/g.58016  ORF Transcript_21574/g.58016 Transcript_21574/m.58016 type:complete len:245 (-) Transcript_21574:1196-1930(-)